MVTKDRLRELVGRTTEAYGANPSDLDRIFKFRYKVVDLDDLVPSHTDTLTPNPSYPAELQPRQRDRAASRAQIDNMAQNLNPRVLLTDSGFLDTGPMIVGKDNVVESGNGRVLALRKSVTDNPDRYRLYKNMLAGSAEQYGLTGEQVRELGHPVLVRERLTDVDRVKFAAEANQSAVLTMSPFEQALQDSKRLSDNIINTFEVGEDQTIDQAIKARANDHLVNHFLQTIPANERAALADSHGSINQNGLNRLKMAIFAKTYPDENGQRLTRTFSESADPLIRNIENGMFQSLPDMAKAQSLIATGKRDKDLAIAGDMAQAVDTYSILKQRGISVQDYLKQSHMFKDELTPLQKQILEHLDDVGRSPKKIREFMRDTAQAIEATTPPGQSGMMGFDKPTKEGIVNAIIKRQGQVGIGAASAPGAGLEKSDTGGTEGAKGMAEEVRGHGQEAKKDVQADVLMAPGTSVRAGLPGFPTPPQQVEAFAEFSGKGGQKQTLIDAEKIKEQEAAKPLPGQIDFITGKTVEGHEVPMRTHEEPPTKPAAEFGKAPKPSRVRFNRGDIDSVVNAALRLRSAKTKYVFATHTGFGIYDSPPPAQDYVEVKPDGTIKRVKHEPWNDPKLTGPKPAPAGGDTLEHLQALNEARSPMARALDKSQRHSLIVEPNSSRTVRWKRDYGSMDVLGVDTPGNVTKANEPPMRERIPRITNQRAIMGHRAPRITQRFRKLR